MITGFLEHWDEQKKYFPKCFDKAISFVKKNDLLSFKPGTYQIDEDKIFAILQTVTTQKLQDRLFEIHKNYLDIQVLLSGTETQFYNSQFPNSSPCDDRLEKDDIAFYAHPNIMEKIELKPQQYVVYMPYELHCPICATNNIESSVTKVVLKIHNSCVL